MEEEERKRESGRRRHGSLARRGGISSRVLSGNSRAPTNPPTATDHDAEDRREGGRGPNFAVDGDMRREGTISEIALGICPNFPPSASAREGLPVRNTKTIASHLFCTVLIPAVQNSLPPSIIPPCHRPN